MYQDGVAQVANKITDNNPPALADGGDRVIRHSGTSAATAVQATMLSSAFWSTVLTPSEVTAIYNGNGGGAFDLNFDQGNYASSGTLEHWWRFGHQVSPNLFIDYADAGSYTQTLDDTNMTNSQICLLYTSPSPRD